MQSVKSFINRKARKFHGFFEISLVCNIHVNKFRGFGTDSIDNCIDL